MAALRLFARSYFATVLRLPADPAITNFAPFIQLAEVQKRWSSYKSSPVYKDPSHYTNYEITKDPVEWSFVERLIANKIIPKPPKENRVYQSGWKPSVAKPGDYPYHVLRTKNHLQAVYLKISFRGLRRETFVKKIQGDIWKLEEELKKAIEEKECKKVGCRVNELVGEIRFRGDFVTFVKQWLLDKGF